MKKQLLFTAAITALVSFTQLSNIHAAPPHTSSEFKAQTVTILDRHHLYSPKIDFDEPLWQRYFNPNIHLQNSMNTLKEVLYQNILSQINDSPDFTETQKQEYREGLKGQIDEQIPSIAQQQREIHPLALQAHQYARGKGVKQNDVKTNELILELLSEEIDIDLYELLAIRAMHGLGYGNEYSEAMTAFETLAKYYEEDHPSPVWAYLSYGYTYGIGVQKDHVKAKHYWALAKHYYSLTFDRTGVVGYMMGQMIEENDFLNGSPADAMNYYNIATRATDNNIAAQKAILKLLKTEKKFEDLSYEIELFMAEQSDLNNPDTLFTLSELYAQKQWKIYNPQKSLTYLESAAQLKHHNALIDLGRFHQTGHLVERNSQKAIEWYKKGFENGVLVSGILLASLYENGNTDLKKDLKLAQHWKEKVAKAYKAAGYEGEPPTVNEINLNRRLYS